MTRNLFISPFLLFLLSACFKDTHKSLFKSTTSNNTKYEIKLMISGCCGCKSIYYNLYKGKWIEEQFIHEYICGFGKPTKYIFHYDSLNNFTGVSPMMAVYDSTFSRPVTPGEKQILSRIDSLFAGENIKDRKLFTAITGFREIKTGDKIHPFAIGRKGNALFAR